MSDDITLRDRLAGYALIGLVIAGASTRRGAKALVKGATTNGETEEDYTARAAYELADACRQERAR